MPNLWVYDGDYFRAPKLINVTFSGIVPYSTCFLCNGVYRQLNSIAINTTYQVTKTTCVNWSLHGVAAQFNMTTDIVAGCASAFAQTVTGNLDIDINWITDHWELQARIDLDDAYFFYGVTPTLPASYRDGRSLLCHTFTNSLVGGNCTNLGGGNFRAHTTDDGAATLSDAC